MPKNFTLDLTMDEAIALTRMIDYYDCHYAYPYEPEDRLDRVRNLLDGFVPEALRDKHVNEKDEDKS